MNFLINAIILLVLVDAILSFIPDMRSNEYALKLKRLVDTILSPVRSILPQNLPIDISPLILIFLLRILGSLF
jgi:uncharacterized protein YggT (Ycf19 family)